MTSWKSDLWTPKKSTKGLLTNPWGIDSYFSMTHHKPSSLNNLQCQSSCSNLVSIQKNLIYILKLEQVEVVDWLLAGLNILSNLPTGFRKILIYQVFCLANLNKNLSGSVLVVLPFNSIIKKQVRD